MIWKNLWWFLKKAHFSVKFYYFLNRQRFLLLCFYTRNSFEVHLSRKEIIPEKYSQHEKLVQLARTRGISSSLYLCSDRDKKKTLRHVSLLQSIFSNLSCLSFKLLGENIYMQIFRLSAMFVIIELWIQTLLICLLVGPRAGSLSSVHLKRQTRRASVISKTRLCRKLPTTAVNRLGTRRDINSRGDQGSCATLSINSSVGG